MKHTHLHRHYERHPHAFAMQVEHEHEHEHSDETIAADLRDGAHHRPNRHTDAEKLDLRRQAAG